MEFCICCGAVVPEGRWICWQCENGDDYDREERNSKGRAC